MSTYIALLRGINVGGKNVLPMANLRESFEGLGFESVRTYIQSGNVVFKAKRQSESDLAELIGETIRSDHGLETPVLVLSQRALESAIDGNPFDSDDPKRVHFFFLQRKPSSKVTDSITEHCKPSESFQLIGKVFYLHTPDGFAKSKVATKVERLLGVPATARNLRTAKKLQSMSCE